MKKTPCLACKKAGTRGLFVKDMPSVVYYPPISMPGQPTLEGHRLSAEHMASRAYALGIDEVMDDYQLTRQQVLVCCWWAGSFGPRRLKKALGEWAEEANNHLWHSCVRVPNPPQAEPRPAGRPRG